MPQVRVSNEAYIGVQKFAVVPFIPGTRIDDGSWIITVSRKNLDKMNAIKLPDEDLSATILRMLAGSKEMPEEEVYHEGGGPA
jgi:hypothetical protein